MISLQSVVLGLFGGVTLVSLYGLIRSDWPQLYTYNRTPLERTIRQTAFRYFLFRTIPPAVVFSAVAVSADRLVIDGRVSVAACVLYFIARSSFQAAAVAVKHRTRMLSTCAMQLVSATWITILGLIAFCQKGHIQGLIPSPSAFVEAGWAAMFVAVVFYACQNLMRASSPSCDDMIAMAKKDIGDVAWAHALYASMAVRVPACILLALMVAESVQRPRWFRRLERLASRMLFNRVEFTQGVTQEKSASTLSDEQAIDITAKYIACCLSDMEKELLANGRSHSICINQQEVRKICERVARSRNKDGRYVEEVVEYAIALWRGCETVEGGVAFEG